MFATEYTISEIQDNIYSINKYVYLDSIDGKVEFLSNKWHFNLNAYVIANSYLPSDWLCLEMEMPFLQYGPVQTFLDGSKSIGNWVDLKSQCKVYTCDFYVDVSQTNVNKIEISDYSMFLKFNLETSKSLDDVKINCSTQVMNEFRANVNSSSVTANINYSNSVTSSAHQGELNIYDDMFINSKTESYADNKKIKFDTHSHEHLDCALENLADLQTEGMFAIDSVDVDFKYTINNKTYEFKDTLQEKQIIAHDASITYDQQTYFDYSTNEISQTLDGIQGFYISKFCLGTYDMKIKIVTANDNCKYLNISNSFSFDKNKDIAYSIEAKQTKFTTDNTYNEENL